MTLSTEPRTGLFITRYPIFNRNLAVTGYELVVCPHPTNEPVQPLEHPLIAQALVDMLGNIGLDSLVGDKLVLLPPIYQLIYRLPIASLPAGKVILQLAKDTPLDQFTIDRLSALIKSGYTLALDQVTAVNEWVAHLAAITQVYKVPVHGRDPIHMSDVIARLRLSRSKICAQAVETLDEQTYYNRLGCDYFQGFFFCQPRPSLGRRADASRMGVMRTLAMIQDPSADFPRLGKIIAQDTALSQKLLTLVNSLSFSLPRPVSTLEQAVAFMGLKQLRSWMTMLTLASIPGKPPELTTLAILRARMCEILAQTFGQKQSDVFFVVGLFSVLDALLDLPLIQAISGISLQTEVVEGLVNRGGAAGQVLNLALAYERGNWAYLLQTGIKPEILTSAYLNAARWATEVSSSVAEKK